MTPDGGVETLIADGYAFRSEQASADELNYLVTRISGAGSALVEELSLAPIIDEVSFEDWVTSHSLTPEESGPEYDADGDGVSNLMEYFTGSDPQFYSSRNVLQIELLKDVDSDQEIHLTFRKSRQATGVDYALYQTENLDSWDKISSVAQTTGAPLSETQEEFKMIMATDTSDQKFYQLRVTLESVE